MESAKDAKARKNRQGTHPLIAAGFFNKLFFTWMLPLFYKGYKNGLEESDIYHHLQSHDSELLGRKLEKEWEKEVKNNKNPSLWKAYAKTFGREMMLYGVGVLVFELMRLTLPLTLAKLLQYFEPDTTVTPKQAYTYAGLICLTTLTQMTIIHHSMYHIFHMGMRMRVASVALVYRKAIKLSKSSLAQTTIGQMVNLISNDVSRFETSLINVHNLWIGPVQLIFLLFLLYWYSGWTALTGVGLLLTIIPFQVWLGKQSSVYRLRTALKLDERICLMSEIINGIQVIKMYTWEKPFTKLIEYVRRSEMSQIRKHSVLKAIHISFNVFLSRLLIWSCVIVYVLTGNTVNAQYIFGLSIFYEMLRQCLSQAFAQGIAQLSESIVSTRRIREFLLFDELDTKDFVFSGLGNGREKSFLTGSIIQSIDSTKPFGVTFENVSTRWVKSNTDYTLEGINFAISSGELAAVIGKVGSGKSTLLHVILKELPPVTGVAKINGTVSYASQEPWLFVGSVRQNILFGLEYNVVKYREVVRVCALERDFKLFPYGDKTQIGERGVSLSGGQRARINLARAVYRDADLYLLDDPLSAVDARVGKEIFKNCIEGYLKDKAVVLVTHQLQYLKACKKIYLLNGGKLEHTGSFDDIKKSGKQFAGLFEEMRKMEEEAKKEVDEERKRKRTMSIKSFGSSDMNFEEPSFEKEAKIEGKVSLDMYKTYFKAGGGLIKTILLLILFVFSQGLASSIDYFLSVWVNMEEMKIAENVTGDLNQTLIETLDTTKYSSIQLFWFRLLNEELCLMIYTSLIMVVSPLIIWRAILFFKCCISSSINLHNNMFSKIIHAPMRFFNLNPSGRILNRFSKDMNLVDENLPNTVSDTLQVGLMMSAIIVVVATVVPLILLPTAIILTIFYLIRVVFIASSRDVKRFEALMRSPVYTHLTASLQGLTTIRACEAQEMVTKEFDNYQDTYSSVCFMFISANRAFGYWLDLHTNIFVACVTFSFLLFKNGSSGGSVGLAISQSINLAGWFQWGIRQWSEMENTMTSVERVKEYSEIAIEKTRDARDPPSDWPVKGQVHFDNVSLRYAKDEPYVLQNLQFLIKPREKIGIVGRTGAGKSSIIAALFRLAENDGVIAIDGVNTSTVTLERLRSSLSIIPQEPVLFSGSLRKNLDPFDEYSDDAIWHALEQVELKSAVLDLSSGLESQMSEGGSNFSVGQRQLVCLARAIVRRNKILVLDEATANVDPHTDNLIQTTIRRKFADCTVLTIAHRLHTIMDSDKVLVMDSGRMAEFDHPYLLLQEEKSIFFSLVSQTGRAMAANLLDIAKKSYNERDQKD